MKTLKGTMPSMVPFYLFVFVTDVTVVTDYSHFY